MDGLRDHPIAGDAVSYLDNRDGGDAVWSASAPVHYRGSASCTFSENTDLGQGGVSVEEIVASTREECCALCTADNNCFGAVYFDSMCFFKDQASAAKPQASEGLTACVLSDPPRIEEMTVPATIPGDLISDLHAANIIGDPLYELNFKNSSIWHENIWTYSTTFDTSSYNLQVGDELLLVFDGIKMGANISVNGHHIGQAEDQFLRYSFPLVASGVLHNEVAGDSGNNRLTISFDSSACIDGRFMACTGGWDWAPYTTTRAPDTHANTFSKESGNQCTSSKSQRQQLPIWYHRFDTMGLTQHPGLSMVNMEDLLLALKYFCLRMRVSGSVEVSGSWGAHNVTQIDLKAGSNFVILELDAKASDMELWWPVGVGKQPLYNVTAKFTPTSRMKMNASSDLTPIETSRRIGFRHFALVTGNDTDPVYVADSVGKEGTSTLGMWWRINGAPIWSSGANMIPMEELEGRLSGPAHRRLVKSAVEANMNTLRVWGGGIFLPSAFYDACDELGVLVYHDMQYAQQGHSPKATKTQDAELRHQIRRLSSHPSIVMWDGCNECHVVMDEPTGIYATFVMTVVAEEDQSRAVWPSCPASGWTAGVDRLTVVPTGKNPLSTPDKGPNFENPRPIPTWLGVSFCERRRRQQSHTI